MVDADSAWVVYSLTGGEAGTYTITCTASGRITVVGTCNDLTGPADTDSIKVECSGEGRGSLQIVCEKDAAVVGSCGFCFTNDASGNMKEIPCWAGPTMTEWGLVVFAGLFIALLIFVIRKRARVPTPA